MSKRTRFPDGTTGIDLSGQKFGKLTVIEYAGKSKDNRAMFYCECECGKSDVFTGTYLVQGKRIDCGCSSRWKGEKLNLVGQTFNELTAIKEAGKHPKGHILYEFKCSCGNTKVLVGGYVASGRTKSCGCLADAKRNEIIGKTFNKLTAIKWVGKDKYNSFLYEFKCSCGNTKILPANRVKFGTTKSCGCLASKPDLSVIGKKFGMLTAIRFAGRNKDKRNNAMYEFQCDCGNKKVLRGSHVTGEGTRSCGCLLKKIRVGIRSDMEEFVALGHKLKLYMQKDVEKFAGMTYHRLLKSGKYRKDQLPPQALQSKLLVMK